MQRFDPTGVITITTDFGHKGPFVGVMKGVIAGRFRAAHVIDLTHDIPAHWPPEAGFWMSRAYRWFPPGSVHLGIVDPGVGTERDILLAVHDGHLFIVPDNGLLDPLLTSAATVCRLDPERTGPLALAPPSATFHGRDIFAPLAAELAAGRVDYRNLGDAVSDWVPGWLDDPQVAAGRVSGVIVTVDAFGNLISNIDGGLLETFRTPEVRLAGHRLPMLTTYGRAQPGSYLALVNSFGVLEIARAEGNAADGTG
ncbi:MAG: SAM-dependent chlorinase/fluorinase [Woeseiaceae bacterium]|nr:SAM-dependent chlorinase/fluorinase [Woeseiaceae bacterium]